MASDLRSLSPGAKTWRFLDRIAEKTVIDAGPEVFEFLKLCALAGVSGALRTDSVLIGQARALVPKEKGSAIATFELLTDIPSIQIGERLIWSCDLFREHYVLVAQLAGVEGTHLSTSTDTIVYRVHQRQLDRCVLKEEEPILVQVRELSGRRILNGRVTDLSTRGLGLNLERSLKVDVDRMLSLEQDVLVLVNIPGVATPTPVPARIVHWDRTPSSGDGIHLGVACSIPLALGDQHSLEDFLLERKYENVRRARTDIDYQGVWRLLDSAYRSLNTIPDSSRMASSIITWKKASWSPRPLNRIYVLRDTVHPSTAEEVEIIGTFSSSRYYSKTWLLHQLAVDGNKGQVLSPQLYGRVVDYLRQTDEVRYVMGTFPSEARVFQRYYIDFIQNDPHQEFHYLEKTGIYEFDVEKALAELEVTAPPARVVIEPISNKTQSYVFGELRSRFPKLFLQALDLSEFDCLLQDASATYEKVALRRKREIHVAHLDGHPVGFVMGEWGSDDQNVFSLFDNFRLFCSATNAEGIEVRRELMRTLFKSYTREKVRTVISWSQDKSLLEAVTCGKEFHGAYFWIAAANRMGPFLRHLDLLHGRLKTIRQRNSQQIREP